MKIIITAGGTSEKIDNVRKITNSSSGKLGLIIASEILNNIDDVFIYYICSKNSFRPSDKKVKIIEVDSVLKLKDTVINLLNDNDINYFVHSMAVSDYMTDYVTNISKIKESIIKYNNIDINSNLIEKIEDSKISSYEDNLVIVLKRTPKVISLIKEISPKTHLIGFKLLDNVSEQDLINTAKKLKEKNKCDVVVANDLSDIKNGCHKAYIIDDNSIYNAYGKEDIAKKLVRRIKYGK